MLWLGRSLGRSNLLFIFLDQATHRVRRLRTLANPILNTFNVQSAIMAWYFRIVRADDLDKFSVAWTPAVGHYYFVIRAIFCPFST